MLTKILYFSSVSEPKTEDFLGVITSVLHRKEFENIELNIYAIERPEVTELIFNYNIQAVPCLVFVDDKGEMIRKITGKIPENDLVTYITFDLKHN